MLDSLADYYIAAFLILDGIICLIITAVCVGQTDWKDLFWPWSSDPPSDPKNRVPYRRPDDV